MSKPDQRTDDENSKASDPNLVGSQATQAVKDERAGKMTPSCEYGTVDLYPPGYGYGAK